MDEPAYGLPSPAQGIARFGAWEFSSAFDSGNALVSSWSCDGRPAFYCNGKGGKEAKEAMVSKAKAEIGHEVQTISVEVARDCHGEPKLQNPHAYWFHFGITPPPTQTKAEVKIVVKGVQQQRDLLAKCYRPWVLEPSRPRWRRSEAETEASTGPPRGWQISWRHQFDGSKGMTRFAFSHPYGYMEMQAWLGRLQCDLGSSAGPVSREELRSAEVHFLNRFELCPPDEAPLQLGSAPVSPPTSDDEDDGPGGSEIYYFESRDWQDFISKAGSNIYFHRQAVAFTPRKRRVEMLTVTEAPPRGSALPREELPQSVLEAMRNRRQDAPPEAPALRFEGRPVVFFSGRVHPGETPGSFAVNGLLQFILSDDPRAAELRRRFVFKVCPMLNPDGVAWGHSRFNTLGYDLNRCYRAPAADQQEGVFAVKQLLLSWAAQQQLFFYMDCHGHMNKRGCFLFANHNGDKMWSSEDALLWNLAYAHAAQLNCPHLDIDNCEWSKHFDKQPPSKKGKNRDEEETGEGDDEADETSRAESGRAQIGEHCRLYHAYTLECSYNTGRYVRPAPEAPGIPAEVQALQSLANCSYEGRRMVPPPYGPREWAAVGEALGVAILDLHCRSGHSRLLAARPPKPFLPPSRDLEGATFMLERLWDALQARHAGKPPKSREGLPPEEHGLRRRIFQVVHSPHVYIRAKPNKTGSAITTKKPGDKVAILEVRGDGWARLCESEVAKFTRKGVTEGYMLIDGTALGLKTLLTDTGETITVPDPSLAEGAVPAQLAPSIEDVEVGQYPPEPGSPQR